jgi:hypothetical protein
MGSRRGAGSQSVAGAADRFDEAVPTPSVDLAAQAPDVHLDDVGAPGVVRVPHAVEQLLLGEDPVRVAGQVLEEGVLLGGQAQARSPASGHEPRRVELEVGHPDQRMTGSRRAPAQRARPGQELRHRERLRQVVVRTTVQTLDPLLDLVAGRDDEDRGRAPPVSESSADGESIEPREDHVEQDQVVSVRCFPIERCSSIADDIDRPSIPGERGPDRLGDRRLVFDDERSHDSADPATAGRPIWQSSHRVLNPS